MTLPYNIFEVVQGVLSYVYMYLVDMYRLIAAIFLFCLNLFSYRLKSTFFSHFPSTFIAFALSSLGHRKLNTTHSGTDINVHQKLICDDKPFNFGYF